MSQAWQAWGMELRSGVQACVLGRLRPPEGRAHPALVNDYLTTGYSIPAVSRGLGSGPRCADPGQSCRSGPWEGGGPGPLNSSLVPVLLLANHTCLMGLGALHKATTQCPPPHPPPPHTHGGSRALAQRLLCRGARVWNLFPQALLIPSPSRPALGGAWGSHCGLPEGLAAASG